jgi:transcriptional regulator
MAVVNPQAFALDGVALLVIFQEPHVYISPTLYDKKENAPTWN